MGVDLYARCSVHGGPGGQRSRVRGGLQQPQHAHRHQLLHRQPGRRRLHGHPVLSATHRHLGRHRDLVHGHGAVQDRLVLPGQ